MKTVERWNGGTAPATLQTAQIQHRPIDDQCLINECLITHNPSTTP